MTLEDQKDLISSGAGETLEVKETTGQRVDACVFAVLIAAGIVGFKIAR